MREFDMRLVVALALLSGCDVVLGLKQTFDAMPDGPLPDAAGGCWTVLYQDHDEDQDGRMDGCDNCPAMANSNQADGDADGVGDVCDGSTGQDRIAYFRSFSSSSHLDGMSKLGGSWHVVNDSLFQDSQTIEAAIALPGMFVGARAYTQVRGISPGSTAHPLRSAGLAVSGDLEGMTGLTCGGRKRVGALSEAFLARAGTGAADTKLTSLGGLVGIQLTTSGPNGTPACEVVAEPPVALVISGVGPTAGKVGFGTTESTAEFLSITVIEPR